jgi:hypothetical protein
MRWDFFRRSEPEDLAARTGSAARDERLSDYLEGILSAEERRAVEDDLARDAGLRTMLDGMALVRDGMHELGMMRSPRSFTITASRRPRSSGLPRLELGMRIATAAASVALVAAFVGPTFLGGSNSDEAATGQPVTVQSRAAKDGEATASDAAAASGASATTESFAASAPAPTEVTAQLSEGAPAGGVGGAGGGADGGVEPAPGSGAALGQEAPPAASPENATPGLAGGGDAGSAAASGAAETAPATPAAPAVEAGTPAGAAVQAPLPVTPAPAAGDLARESAPGAVPTGDDAALLTDDSSGIDWVQWSRLGAGALAVALALGSLGLWWQRRRTGQYGM